MENIFENAYFGKPYKTRDGRKAIFLQFDEIIDTDNDNIIGKLAYVYTIQDGEYSVNMYGYDADASDILRNAPIVGEGLGYDIVSEWQEEINEEELDDEARDKFEEIHSNTNSVDEPHERALMKMKWFRWGYSAGYRNAKAKEV